VLLAGDEASLYLQASLMRVWAAKGQTPVVRVDAGRDSTHFYGAVNLQSGQEVVLSSDRMTGEVSALFLNRLLLAYPEVPILLLWDRATWHKGAEVRAVLEANPRLEVVWFPPGCPELNPQESVWKAARESVSHNHRHANLETLAPAFEQYLTTQRFPCSLLAKHGYETLCARFK
jgi:transposase